MEQVEFLAQLPVVAGLCLFQQLQMGGQFTFLGERHPVHSGQLFLRLVPFPIGPSDGHDFGGFDVACVRDVGAAAQICELPLRVECDCPVLKALQQIQLVLVPFLVEIRKGLRLGHVLSQEGLLGLGQFQHFLFDCRNVCVRERVLPKVHIVVKSIFHRWPHPKLDAWVDGLKCFCHQMRRTVPKGVHAFLVA